MFVNYSMQRILLLILLTTSLFAKDIIAVLELEHKGLTKQEAEILTDRLTTKLVSIDKYQVVERTNMDKILKEQKFQGSGCTDSECAVEIGQLLNTDFIVIGSVSKFGSTWVLDARLINIGQGNVHISAEFSAKGEIDILLNEGMISIAEQLCGVISKEQSVSTKETNKRNLPVIEPKIQKLETLPDKYKYSTSFHDSYNQDNYYSTSANSINISFNYFPIIYPNNKPHVVPFNNQSPWFKLEIQQTEEYYEESFIEKSEVEYSLDIRYVTNSGWDFQVNGKNQGIGKVGFGKYIGKYSLLIKNHIENDNEEQSVLLNYYFNNYHSVAYKFKISKFGHSNYFIYKNLINKYLFELEFRRYSANSIVDFWKNRFTFNSKYFFTRRLAAGIGYYYSQDSFENVINRFSSSFFINVNNFVITTDYSLYKRSILVDSSGNPDSGFLSMTFSIGYLF